MKNLVLILSFSMTALFAFGQHADRDSLRNPQAREKIRAAHAAYITERLQLTAAQAEKFWPVYREYAQKRRHLRDQLRDARRSGADEKTLLDLDLKLKQQEVELERNYTERFVKIISPEQVVKLHEAEADFRKLLLRQVQRRRR